jgi:DNA-binding CsgD family transcriptional regulator
MPSPISIREIKAVTDRIKRNSSASDQISALSDRERQIALLVSRGLGNKD